MTDDDVLTAVRECLTTARDRAAGEQMARPARTIIARARRRRLRQGLVAAAAAVIAAAVAASALLPGNGSSPARLAAWTVTTRPGGQITVTIRELRDPAGLQRQLRADGVPATVRFTKLTPRLCLYYRVPQKQTLRLLARIFPPTGASGAAFTINSAAIPAGVGLWITIDGPLTLRNAHSGRLRRSNMYNAIWTLVYASGRCPPGRPERSQSGGGSVIGTPPK